MSKETSTDPRCRTRPLAQPEHVIKQQFVISCVNLSHLMNAWLAGHANVTGDNVQSTFKSVEAVEAALSAVAQMSVEDIHPDFTKAGEEFLRNARGFTNVIPNRRFGKSEESMDVDYVSLCNYNMKCMTALHQMLQTA